MEIAEEELGNTRTSGKAMYRKAMDLFQEVYEDWRSRLGELSIKTVKAITMLATVANRMDGPLAAIEWSKKEVNIREELQGKLHPRTQQARRNYAALLNAMMKLKEGQDQPSGAVSGPGEIPAREPGGSEAPVEEGAARRDTCLVARKAGDKDADAEEDPKAEAESTLTSDELQAKAVEEKAELAREKAFATAAAKVGGAGDAAKCDADGAQEDGGACDGGEAALIAAVASRDGEGQAGDASSVAESRAEEAGEGEDASEDAGKGEGEGERAGEVGAGEGAGAGVGKAAAQVPADE